MGAAVQKALDAYRFVRAYQQHLPLACEALLTRRCALRLLEGTLAGGGEALTLLYVGREKNLAWLQRTIFEDWEERGAAETTVLAARQAAAAMAGRADVVVADIGWPWHGRFDRRGEFVEVPDWISMCLDLPGSWEEVVAGFRRTARNNDLRLIRRNGWDVRVARGRDAVDAFYDGMYLPYVRRRHGDASVIASRREVRSRAKRGAILEVVRGSEMAAAGVVYPEDGVLYFLWTGVPARLVEAPPEGAISALNFFVIRHAFDSGCSAVDFAGTRAFPGDGIYQFKRRWGTYVEDTFSPSSLLLRPRQGSAAAVAFCRRFPVIARRGDELEALFVAGETADGDYVRRLDKQYHCAGIERLTVIEVGARAGIEAVEGERKDCAYRILRCRPEAFAACWVAGGA